MVFFNRKTTAQSGGSMDYEINKLAHSLSTLVLRVVDGSNADERRLVMNAKQLGDIANSNASWRLTSSYLLATCEQAVSAVDFSTEGERQLYYEALELVQQFEYSRASCA